MKAVLTSIVNNRYTIGTFAGIGVGFFGWLWSAAAGDTFGIIAFFAFFASSLIFCGGMAAMDKAEARKEPWYVAFTKFAEEALEDKD